MATREVDLVIVGASFAGLICARSAALRGLKAVVIESKSDPGARIHTTGILVREAAEEIDTPAKFSRAIHSVRLYAPHSNQSICAHPAITFSRQIQQVSFVG